MRNISNFHDANAALLEYVPPNLGDRSYTLETMRKLMQHLGNPQETVRVIHVAGTSGKTSTCYYIASILTQAGNKVGLTVSPHIDEINERVQINMKPLGESEFCSRLTEFLALVDESGLQPSYFEVLVAFAYWVFAREDVDYAVVEVGLGGLLDGTNVVSRHDKVSVITDIGLDHTHVLGNTVQEIAMQKAGIILPESEVFMLHQPAEVMRVVKQVCDQKHALLQVVDETNEHHGLPLFQERNWQLARAVAQHVHRGVTPEQLAAAAQAVVPARMEIIQHGTKTIVFDGSHNQQKLAALAGSLKQSFGDEPIAAVMSFGTNKTDIVEDGLREILPLLAHVTYTTFHLGQDEYRSPIDPKVLKSVSEKNGFGDTSIIDDPVQAFQDALQRPEKIILVTGSFYLLNHVRPLILKK